ncbi:MAG: hypothetical protein J07HN4v3_00679 [Halonotius sp. J07HN4]|nr:MAG: hypothetical protein J07HN4v3_00679 [Halonotius sp. J07HN4]
MRVPSIVTDATDITVGAAESSDTSLIASVTAEVDDS